MAEDARYIDVPIASGPNSTVNTCGGCGGALAGNSHHVFDCLIFLNNRIKTLEIHPATVGNCMHHSHHNHNVDMNLVNGVEFCPVCQHGPPW